MRHIIPMLILTACPAAETIAPTGPDVGYSVCPSSGETGIGAGPSAVLAWECWPDGGCVPLDIVWHAELWDYRADCTPGLEVVAMVAW